MKYAFAGVLASLGLLLVMGVNDAGEKKPKHTIPEVMKGAHKSGLWKKVATGKASDDEKEKLVEYYTSLSLNEPPAGELKAWKEKTTAMLDAAKGAAKGDDQAAKKLLTLVNCGQCHKQFKSE